MVSDLDALKAAFRRWTLALGVLQVTVGCMVGFVPPTAVPWFRGIVMSHIEYTANGVLLIAFGFLASELRLGPAALKTWFASLQIGTWMNGTAGVVAAFSGHSSPLLPTANEKFPPPHGADSPVVTGLLLLCGAAMMLALTLTLVGMIRSYSSKPAQLPPLPRRG